MLFLCTGGQQQSPQLALVLVGRKLTGKTSCADSLVGTSDFSKDSGGNPHDAVCKRKSIYVGGTKVNVIDTEFSRSKAPEMAFKECKGLCEGSMCVYLLVCKIPASPHDLYAQLQELERGLATRVMDRAIILFTHGETLGPQQGDDFLKPDMKELISRCAKRYQVFNNTDQIKIKMQLKELKEKITSLVQEIYGVKVFEKQKDKSIKNKLISSCVIA